MKLTRPSSGRILGGVCAGIAKAMDWDPTVVRVAFAAASIFGGAGVWIYLIAWVIIPAEDGTSGAAQMREMWDESRARRQAKDAGETFDPYRED